MLILAITERGKPTQPRRPGFLPKGQEGLKAAV